MSKIFRSLTDPDLLPAIDANFGEEIGCFGRSLFGAELHVDPEVTWFRLGRHNPNGILHNNFAQKDADAIHASIKQLISYFQRHGIHEISWRVGPATQPTHFETYLQAHKFQHRFTTHCLTLQIPEEIPASLAPPCSPNIAVTEVLDVASLRIKSDVERDGFESSIRAGEQYYQTYLFHGFGPGTERRHYIGWLQEKPVAVSALLLHAGIAGIYGVTTLPEARRQGIGTLMTTYVLHEARKAGYAIAVLSSTPMSHAIYQRLGFEERCQIEHYSRSDITAEKI
jgi:ribosomal protein S18 acetylase RimI-like enzyme